jgi:hypothetical protein
MEFSHEWAGITFERGLYRFVDAATGPRFAGMILDAFPDFARRAHPFAYDWLGRAFAVDENRLRGGKEPMVLLLEPGTGEALEIPYSFASLHDNLDELREPALAGGFFATWSKLNPSALPLSTTVCVGYKQPLFLGGKDTAENLEVVDMEIYWSLCGQLFKGTRKLPPGTKIRGVSSGD